MLCRRPACAPITSCKHEMNYKKYKTINTYLNPLSDLAEGLFGTLVPTSIAETAVAGNRGGDHPVLLLLAAKIRLAVPNIEREIQTGGACSISHGRYPSWATE